MSSRLVSTQKRLTEIALNHSVVKFCLWGVWTMIVMCWSNLTYRWKMAVNITVCNPWLSWLTVSTSQYHCRSELMTSLNSISLCSVVASNTMLIDSKQRQSLYSITVVCLITGRAATWRHKNSAIETKCSLVRRQLTSECPPVQLSWNSTFTNGET